MWKNLETSVPQALLFELTMLVISREASTSSMKGAADAPAHLNVSSLGGL